MLAPLEGHPAGRARASTSLNTWLEISDCGGALHPSRTSSVEPVQAPACAGQLERGELGPRDRHGASRRAISGDRLRGDMSSLHTPSAGPHLPSLARWTRRSRRAGRASRASSFCWSWRRPVRGLPTRGWLMGARAARVATQDKDARSRSNSKLTRARATSRLIMRKRGGRQGSAVRGFSEETEQYADLFRQRNGPVYLEAQRTRYDSGTRG